MSVSGAWRSKRQLGLPASRVNGDSVSFFPKAVRLRSKAAFGVQQLTPSMPPAKEWNPCLNLQIRTHQPTWRKSLRPPVLVRSQRSPGSPSRPCWERPGLYGLPALLRPVFPGVYATVLRWQHPCRPGRSGPGRHKVALDPGSRGRSRAENHLHHLLNHPFRASALAKSLRAPVTSPWPICTLPRWA